MTKYKVEVRDKGGCSVGTAVFVTASKERAISWLAVTLKERWAGAWSVVGPDVDINGEVYPKDPAQQRLPL